MMKKYILAAAIAFAGISFGLSSCNKYDEEPPRVDNPTYMKYKMPDPEPLKGSDMEEVEQIMEEYQHIND